MHEEPCQYARDTKENLNKTEERLSSSLNKVWEALDKLNDKFSNRLPNWATILISILTMFVGGLTATVLHLLFKK